jgi:hypothetical protein
MRTWKMFVIAFLCGAVGCGVFLYGVNKYKEFTTPELRAQAIANAAVELIKEANTGGFDQLYAYQVKKKLPAQRIYAVPVPEKTFFWLVYHNTTGPTPPKIAVKKGK